MPLYVTCECQHDAPVLEAIPQVGDLVICPNCRATLRLAEVTFEPVLRAEVYKPPPSFEDVLRAEVYKPPPSFEDDAPTPIDEEP